MQSMHTLYSLNLMDKSPIRSESILFPFFLMCPHVVRCAKSKQTAIDEAFSSRVISYLCVCECVLRQLDYHPSLGERYTVLRHGIGVSHAAVRLVCSIRMAFNDGSATWKMCSTRTRHLFSKPDIDILIGCKA